MKRPLIETDDHQISQLLGLLKASNSVELKLTVKDSDHRSSIMALDMEVLDAELRQVVFFDTPDLKLNRAGLVVRARRIRKGGDTVIKLRPVKPEELPSSVRRSGSFNVEVDAVPGGFVCSGSLKGKTDNSAVKSVLAGKQPIETLFSQEQWAFFKQNAPKGLELNRLTPLGPINVAKLKFIPQGFERFLVAEVWFFPDGSRVLELSTKCAPNETFQVVMETRAFFKQRGISLDANQMTKTRKALEYFSQVRNRRQTAARKK